jgi:hypothetical protein
MTEEKATEKATATPAFGSVHYLIAAGILLACAVGINATLRTIRFVMAKAEVPLKSSLEELPEQYGTRFELARMVNGEGIVGGKGKLTADVIKTLGTKDFISWLFIDRKLSTPTAPAFVRLHLTYYTNILDATPHVPDNCMVAGGFDPDRKYDGDVTWTVPELPQMWQHWQSVEFKQRGFINREGRRKIVYYIFSANGLPRGRSGVRKMMANAFAKYCYYMKIEIDAFRDPNPLTGEQIAEASEAFFAAAAPAIFQRVMSAEEIDQLEAGR